jgi:hypothetical protein
MAQQTEIQLALDWAVVDCCLHDLPESVQNPSLLFTFERRSTFKIRVWLGALFALASVSYAFLVRCSPCNLLILFGFGSRLVRCRGVPLNFEMDNRRSGESSRTPRNHRGNRSQLTLIARLPQWANNIWIQYKDDPNPRVLRQVLTALRTLIQLLEDRLEQQEGVEADV